VSAKGIITGSRATYTNLSIIFWGCLRRLPFFCFQEKFEMIEIGNGSWKNRPDCKPSKQYYWL